MTAVKSEEKSDPIKETTVKAFPDDSDHTEAHAMIRRLVEKHYNALGSMRSNPKGMTHGDVQRDLAECAKILGR